MIVSPNLLKETLAAASPENADTRMLLVFLFLKNKSNPLLQQISSWLFHCEL